MRTLLNNTKEVDDYVLNQSAPQDALLFEAKLIIDPELKYAVMWHKQTINMVNQYGRNNLRTMIENVHQQLFTQPQHQTFRQKILGLFYKR
jgi:hypothetical protein